MDCLEQFLQNVYVYFTGNVNNNTNIIRIHTRKLEQSGDLSLPLNINNWSCLIDKANVSADTDAIVKFLTCGQEQTNINKLISQSEEWNLNITKCVVIKDNLHIYLDRTKTFKSVINDVRENYGSVSISNTLKINVKPDISNVELSMNLSELRLMLLANSTKNLIRFCGGAIVETEECSNLSVKFSLNASSTPGNCLCGSVLNTKGIKDVTTTAGDFYKQRSIHMRLMAEHKYGLRVTSQAGWKEFFEKLGAAAVTIELLQNKPNHTLTIDINNQSSTSSKGAPFILYNCARLATLFKEFEKKVSQNVYPKLPKFEDIDFTLLTQPEEWELLYVYILQFPCVIKSCIRDILSSKVYLNCLTTMLSGMCLCFSVYYRRVRILTEPKPHMFATLYARIYLLKAVEQVLHNGLKIMDIEPVKQM